MINRQKRRFCALVWGMPILVAALVGWTGQDAVSADLESPGPEAPGEAVGGGYHPDKPFPEFMHLWSEAWSLKGEENGPVQNASPAKPLGGYLQAYIRNGSPNTVRIADLKVDGVSLTEAIAFSDRKAARLYPASIWFSKLSQAGIDRLAAAGEPVWWKADPQLLEPGGFGEVTIRLRHPAKGGAIRVQVVATNAVWEARIPPEESPRFASISFSPNLDAVYCYLQRAGGTRAPVKFLIDDSDVTSRMQAGADTNVSLTPVILPLDRPLGKGSFHCFRAAYDDGSTAVSGIRAWSEELVYGMWGYINQGKTPAERVDYFLGDLRRHNVNAVMESYGGEVGNFLSGESGLEHSRALGIRAMRRQPGKVLNPLYYFLTDEPDAHDYAVGQLDPAQRLGALGQALVRRGWELRQQDPATPHLLNVDNTYKPENWYMYAQLPDVYCADPYFQEQQRIAWNDRPMRAASFIKPWYVLGVATICQSACAPRPLHIILNSVRHDSSAGGFRFATPAEKTVELFYALGAGAKGISYWWYTPYGEFHGCGARDEAAVALWRQIGRLGAQVRTAGPVLTRSCPAAVPLKAPARLWTRTLLAGTDALVLLAVNENIASDRLGTVVVPLPKATVSLTPPAWLKRTDAFEITPDGLRDLNWKAEGGQVMVNLDNTEVARMGVLTADSTLRARLEKLYRARFAANAAPAGPLAPRNFLGKSP